MSVIAAKRSCAIVIHAFLLQWITNPLNAYSEEQQTSIDLRKEFIIQEGKSKAREDSCRNRLRAAYQGGVFILQPFDNILLKVSENGKSVQLLEIKCGDPIKEWYYDNVKFPGVMPLDVLFRNSQLSIEQKSGSRVIYIYHKTETGIIIKNLFATQCSPVSLDYCIKPF